jgi:hypothetical protein
MDIRADEVAADVYRISTRVPEADFRFNVARLGGSRDGSATHRKDPDMRSTRSVWTMRRAAVTSTQEGGARRCCPQRCRTVTETAEYMTAVIRIWARDTRPQRRSQSDPSWMHAVTCEPVRGGFAKKSPRHTQPRLLSTSPISARHRDAVSSTPTNSEMSCARSTSSYVRPRNRITRTVAEWETIVTDSYGHRPDHRCVHGSPLLPNVDVTCGPRAQRRPVG